MRQASPPSGWLASTRPSHFTGDGPRYVATAAIEIADMMSRNDQSPSDPQLDPADDAQLEESWSETTARYAIVAQKFRRRVIAQREARWRKEAAQRRKAAVSRATIRVQSIGRRAQAMLMTARLQRERQERAALKLQCVARRLSAVRELRRRREQSHQDADRAEEAALGEQSATVTVHRVARGSTNERRRGRLSALLRRARPGTSEPPASPLEGLITAEVISPAQPVPPLANVEGVGSLHTRGDQYAHLPHAQVVATDHNIPEPPPPLPAVVTILNSSPSAPPAFDASPAHSSTRLSTSQDAGLRQDTSGDLTPRDSGSNQQQPSAPPLRPDSNSSTSTPNMVRSLRASSIDRPRSYAGFFGGGGARLTEERIKTIADLAAHGEALQSRRGALAILADEHERARLPAGHAALLALVRPLYDEDASVRVDAVKTAHRLGSLELVQFALDDENIMVRRAVLEALAAPGSFGKDDGNEDVHSSSACRSQAALIVALMKALEDVTLDDTSLISALARLRAALLETGVRDGSLLSAPLEKAMQAQRSDRVRAQVVRVAGELQATDALRRVAIFDFAPAVRRVAVEMLGWNAATRELRDFVLADDEDATVRANALEWLARLDDAAGLAEPGLLGDRSAELRARAAELLGDVLARRIARIEVEMPGRGGPLPLCAPPSPPPAPRAIDRAQLAQCSTEFLNESGYADATRALGAALRRDGNVGVRGAAAQQLRRLRCVDELVQGLQDAHTPLRLRVVELVGDLDDADRCSQPLEAVLRRDEEESVRRAAVDRLGNLGDPSRAIDRLATIDAAVKIRELAVSWLSRLKRAEALLDKSLVDTESADVRASAADALCHIFEANEGTAPPSRAAGDTDEPAPRNTHAFRSALLMRLGDEERRVRVAAAAALAAMRERQWAEVIRGDENDCARLAEVRGPKATAVLVFILCNAVEGNDRVAAANALGKRDRDLEALSLNALCACCSEVSLEPRLRVAALHALEALLREPHGPDDEALCEERERRGAAIVPRLVLSADFFERLDAALLKALNDADNADVRLAAVETVGGARSAGQSLTKMLELARPVNDRIKQRRGAETSADVRAACAKNLKRFGPDSRDAAFALLDALSDRDVTTRDCAAAAFVGFRQSEFVAEVARAAVVKLVPGSRKPIAADDKRDPFAPVLRAAAARALGFLEHASTDVVLPALHEALKSDPSPLVRRAVCVALGSLRSPMSLKPLVAPFKDKKSPAIVTAAKEALTNLDYSRFLVDGEAILMQAPCVKRSRKIFTTLKALIMTDARLFYVDAETLRSKNCDIQTLELELNSNGAEGSRQSLAFHLPGQGRVSVLLLYGHAPDWLAARGTS